MRFPKIFAVISFLLLFAEQVVQADAGSFLNYAMLDLPPKYLADIPLSDRRSLIKELSYQGGDNRLDYRYGYINFSSDSDEPDRPAASSMFYLKLLKRPDTTPLVFVHMQKPYNGAKPDKNQTFVLELDSNEWVDVSRKVFPRRIDITAHLRPLRRSNQIEVAPWVQDGKKRWTYGLCHKLLIWNGQRFDERAVTARGLTDDIEHGLRIWPEGDSKSQKYAVVFDGCKLSTLDELKQKLAQLSAGSTLFWDSQGIVFKEIPVDGSPRMTMETFKHLCLEYRIDLVIYSCPEW